MASSCPSQDQQNFECVTIASVDFIKLPLKDILESHIQPVDLFKEINSCPALSSHKHKLRQDQLKLCFLQPPAEPDYRKFDVTLLYTLIRNLCPSVKPTKGWGTQPDDADIQIGDDIERLRLFRNTYYGHASSATISDVDFTKMWKDLKSVINRIQSTTKCSVDYEDELIKIERAKFTRNQLENCKVLLDALVILQQQKEDGEEPHIVIKGEDEIVCGCTANFKADVNKIDLSLWSIKWHKLSGTKSIDKSKEKYRGSTDTTLVIQSVCKEDEGKYQAVISQESKGIEKRMRSNIICLHVVGENLSDNQGSQQQLQESQHNVEENDNNWKAITKTEITTEKEMETLMLETMIKFLLTTIKKPSEFWLVTDLIYILEDTLKTIDDCGRSDLLRELITAIKEDDDIQFTLSRCGKRMFEVLKSMTMKYKSTELKITDGCVCFTFSFSTYEILKEYLNLLQTGDDCLRRDISEVIMNKTLLDIFHIDSNHVTWHISKVTIMRGSTFVREELFSNTVTRNTEEGIKVDEEMMEKIINFFKRAHQISKKDVKPLEVAKACVGPNANKSSVNKYLDPLHRAEIISKTFFKITKDSQSDPRYNALPVIEEITEKKIKELAAKVNSGSKEEKKSLDQPVVTDKEMSPCKNESAASKIAGPEDTTRSVPTAHAPAYPFSKGAHNQKDVLSSIARAEVSKSVGLIHIDGQPVGTGFRVGEKYLVTCIHVIRNVIKVKPHMLDGQRLTIEFYRITYNQKENELLIFSFQPLIAYFDEEYDFVVLELRSHDAGVPFPPALNFFADVFDSEIHLVGHPGGRQMKEDSIKPRWSPDHDEEIIPYISYLAHWSKSHFPDKRDYYSILLEPPRKIIFHTTFDTGSSGSPGVMIRDNRPCVVVMVRGGTPSCFYENRYPHLPVEDDHKVEYGYAMSDIYHKMLESTNQNVKDLASEIFGEWI